MTGKEAYQVLINKSSYYTSEKCYEYKDFFVFKLKPKNEEEKIIMFDCLYCVEKKTSKVYPFLPPNYSKDQLLARREIKDFK